MTTDRSLAACLRESPFGPLLDGRQTVSVLAIGQCEEAAAGQVVFSEGDPAEHLRIICQGHVSLDMSLPGRGRQRILTLGPRDLLGWSALAGDGTMSATATAMEDTWMLRLPVCELRALFEGDPVTGRIIMEQTARALARRLQAARLQLLDLFGHGESVGGVS